MSLLTVGSHYGFMLCQVVYEDVLFAQEPTIPRNHQDSQRNQNRSCNNTVLAINIMTEPNAGKRH